MCKKIVGVIGGYVLFTVFLFLIGSTVYAETVYLKNGKKVEGRIIERTDKYIKIDLEGVTLTFWFDEIEKVEKESKVSSISGRSEKKEEKEQGKSTKSNFQRGTDYLKDGKWQQAIDEFKDIISFDLNHVGAHFNLGCVYALVEKYEEAIEEFNKALSLEKVPFNAFCYFNIAGVYVKQAMSKKDVELFKKAAENFRKAAQALPNFILAIDYANHSEMFASIESLKNVNVIFSVTETGTPPDSAIFLPSEKIVGSGEGRSCIFDAGGPALLYFYRSLSCRYLVCISEIGLQNPFNIRLEAIDCLESLLKAIDNEPPTRFDNLIKQSVLQMLSSFNKIRDNRDLEEVGETQGERVMIIFKDENEALKYIDSKRGKNKK